MRRLVTCIQQIICPKKEKTQNSLMRGTENIWSIGLLSYITNSECGRRLCLLLLELAAPDDEEEEEEVFHVSLVDCQFLACC